MTEGMVFEPTALAGAFVIESACLKDDRGYFARTFSCDLFEVNGIAGPVSQCNVSYNRQRGTLRGMHYQAAPYAEAKLVACLGGAVYDVIIDLRPDSDTYTHWLPVELRAPSPASGDTLKMLYVPEGFAHGYQTLEDHTLLHYQMSGPYHPASARGVRWDDPALDIRWPAADRIISPRDRSFGDFAPDSGDFTTETIS
jgi:dTDP-4-dehydrorhamnose 3,5-epimerase